VFLFDQTFGRAGLGHDGVTLKWPGFFRAGKDPALKNPGHGADAPEDRSVFFRG